LLVVLYKAVLNVGTTLLLLPPLLLVYPVELRWEILLFPLGVFVTMFSGLSIGLALLPFAALFQDLSRAVHLGMRFAFFLTPVVFPLPASGMTRYLMEWNPATYLIVDSRAWLLGGETPQILPFCIVTTISVLLFALGLLTMKVALPHIIERASGG
jgi:lipopolysaccharide transport system permease protein